MQERNSSPAKSFCPVCRQHDRGFKPIDPNFGEMAEKYGYKYFGQGEMTAHETYHCAACGATDRERLYAWWINEMIVARVLHPYTRILHFAPEGVLLRYMKRLRLFSYYETSDPGMSGVDRAYDLMSIDRPSGSVDFFICSHVLEHVPDDRRAIAELYRITAPGGRGILMAPIAVGLEKTCENPEMTSEADRWKHFGQGDHVRAYASTAYGADSIHLKYIVFEANNQVKEINAFLELCSKLNAIVEYSLNFDEVKDGSVSQKTLFAAAFLKHRAKELRLVSIPFFMTPSFNAAISEAGKSLFGARN